MHKLSKEQLAGLIIMATDRKIDFETGDRSGPEVDNAINFLTDLLNDLDDMFQEATA